MTAPTDGAEYERLLIRVAKSYWIDNLTQQQIGYEQSFSRVSVSRLLDEARRRGIVRVAIGEPVDRDFSAERLLFKALRAVGTTSKLLSCRVVVPLGRGTAGDARLLGMRTARTLVEVMPPDGRLAVASSRTVASVAPASAILTSVGSVVEMLGSRPRGGAPVAGALIAEIASVHHTPVATPFIHRTRLRASHALTRSDVAEALRLARDSDVALFGAGSMHRFDGTGLHAPVPLAVLHAARDGGAVGHILGTFLTAGGEIVSTPIDELRVGLSLPDLARVNERLLLATGQEKSSIICSAVRAGLVSRLVTDLPTANAIMDQAGVS